MEDQELIRLAAKAAHTPRREWDYEFLRSLGHMVTPSMMWNPLTDDSEALRLAVKLRLMVQIIEYGASARSVNGRWHGCEVRLHGDLENATRRAIVLAAAEIGKVMP